MAISLSRVVVPSSNIVIKLFPQRSPSTQFSSCTCVAHHLLKIKKNFLISDANAVIVRLTWILLMTTFVGLLMF